MPRIGQSSVWHTDACAGRGAACAARPAAPDYRYYTATRDRRTGGLATLSVARKLARRCYHTLRELGEEALAPAA